MPTYEYQCNDCGHHFEFFQSMSSAKLTDCPQEECKGTVKRLLGTGAGLIFKGSGFYETDYRSENYKAGAKKDAGAAKSSESGSSESKSASSGDSGSKKSESKPATPAASSGGSSTKKD
ncbi:MAG: putative FmdB family regulatory protein [Verrucomicrobiales bacterium]|jgi:putative FmdB family regulatory protein